MRRRTSTNLRAPFFGPRAPIYPLRRQVLRVAAPAGPVYTAFVQQLSGTALRDREPCYLWEPNGLPLAPGKVRGRLVGAYTGIMGTLPLFVTSQLCCTGPGTFVSSSPPSSAVSRVSSPLSAVSSPVPSAAPSSAPSPASVVPASSRSVSAISLVSSPSPAVVSSSSALSSSVPSASAPSIRSPSVSSSPQPVPSPSSSSVSPSAPSSSASACPCVIRGWTSASGTSASPGVPAGTQVNDVMLAFITADTSITDGAGTGGQFAPAVGWTQQAVSGVWSYSLGKTARGFVFSKVAGAGETASTWGDGLNISVQVVSVGNAGTPAAALAQLTASPSPQAGSVTAPAGGLLFVSFHEAGATTINPPAGMTPSGQGTVGNFGTEVSYLQPVSGATGTRTGSGGTGTMAGIAIVLPCCTSAAPAAVSASSVSAVSPTSVSSSVAAVSSKSALPATSVSSSSGVQVIHDGCCNTLDSTVYVTMNADLAFGSCACWPASVTVPLVYSVSASGWTGQVNTCDGGITTITLQCNPGGASYNIAFKTSQGGITSGNSLTLSCNPVSMTFVDGSGNPAIFLSPGCKATQITVTN